MEKNKILDADILDIIFDGKNKLYGAYDLRKTYNKRLAKAIFFTIGLVFFAFLSTILLGMNGKNVHGIFEVTETRLVDIKKNNVLPPLPLVKTIRPAEPNQVKFTTPLIVKNDQVNEVEKIQEISDD